MKLKYKVKRFFRKLNKKMNKPNPEGITSWDALLMTCVPVGVFIILLNLGIYVANHPDVAEKIAKFIFPLAFC